MANALRTKTAAQAVALGQVVPGAYLSMMTQSLALNILGPVLPLLAVENSTTP